ncbi:CD209 antigen-like protein C [Sorex fumeus]|uniref:CD209 antigen-like protein C n=1 Tax=Sorex fumeus TaxID=62283 RepID=UPI0024AE0553|nr:CD209 antigen-like protein C [Sorex fumeus]
MMEKEEKVERSREHCTMDSNSDYEEPDGSERVYVNLKVAENEVPQPQTVRFCSGRLVRVSKYLLQLLTCLGVFLLLVFILVQVSRFHQSLQNWPEACQKSQSLDTQKQIPEELEVIGKRLAWMNGILDRLCRQCPWGWEFFQGSCYWFSRSQTDWASSDPACQSMNARLVVVNNVSEEKFLQSWEVRHEKRTWIGLSDHHEEASWQWVDGTPFQLSFWRPGEPNNHGDEDCVELFNDGWNDIPCSQEKPWICEKPAVSCSQP